MLLTARFVTGVAAAFMTPAGLALVTGAFPEGPQRTKALGVYAGTAAGGFSLGLIAGGVLASIGWRWVFFAPLIVAALVLLAAVPLLKEQGQGAPNGSGLDVLGAVNVTGALLLLVYGVVRLERGGDGLVTTAAVFAAGLLLLGVFVAVERRSAHPLVRLGILRSAALVRTNLIALLFLASFAGFQFMVTLYLQELRGWSALATGLAMLVVGIDTILAPTLTPWLVNRFGNIRVLFGGTVLAALAYLLFVPVAPDWTYAAMLPSLLLLGAAFSLSYGPLTMAATDGVDEREHGLAGGLLYTSIQFGTALGISAVTAISVAIIPDGAGEGVSIEAIRAGLVFPAAAAGVAVVLTAFGLRRRPRAPEPVASRVAGVSA